MKIILELRNNNMIPEVEAAMIGGSIGRKKSDIFSDVDVFLLIGDYDLSVFLDIRVREICNKIGKIILFTGPRNVSNFGYSFTALFESMNICQFTVNNKDTLRPNPMNSAKSLFVFDNTGFYNDFLSRGKNIQVDIENTFLAAYSRFWLRILGLHKEVKRNNLWLAIRFLFDAQEQLMIIKRLEIREFPPGLNFNKPAKYLERDVGEAFSKLIAETIPTYNANSIMVCTLKCGEICLNISTILSEKLSIKIDSELLLATSILNHIRNDFNI